MTKAIRKGLTGILLTGVLGLGGCMNKADYRFNSGLTNQEQYIAEKNAENRYNDALGLSLLGGLIGARGVQVGKPEAVYFGNALSRHGAAQANSSQVIINNSPPVQVMPQSIPNNNYNPANFYDPSVKAPSNVTIVQTIDNPLVIQKDTDNGKTYAVVCNYVRDFNGNGLFSYPDDFRGMKRTFATDERIMLSLVSERPVKMKIEVLDNKGKSLEVFEGEGNNLFAGYNDNSRRLPGNSNYSCAFYVDGQHFGNLEFKVTDGKWRVQE